MAQKEATTKEKKTAKAPVKKTAAKAPAARKPRAVQEETPVAEEIIAVQEEVSVEPLVTGARLNLEEGKYAYAVGRRKTSVANVRLFQGKGKSQVNKKDILAYFGTQSFVDAALRPLQLTGLGDAYVYVNTNGGGVHSQAQAIAHGISLAVAKNNPDLRKVLKKNELLTRDSRMKERKKPGLKRARRGPQWAKR